jgi:hypothetical protein
LIVRRRKLQGSTQRSASRIEPTQLELLPAVGLVDVANGDEVAPRDRLQATEATFARRGKRERHRLL